MEQLEGPQNYSQRRRLGSEQLDKKMEQFDNGCYVSGSVLAQVTTRSKGFRTDFFVLSLITRCLKRWLHIQAAGELGQLFTQGRN
jgi:hypothetical protein